MSISPTGSNWPSGFCSQTPGTGWPNWTRGRFEGPTCRLANPLPLLRLHERPACRPRPSQPYQPGNPLPLQQQHVPHALHGGVCQGAVQRVQALAGQDQGGDLPDMHRLADTPQRVQAKARQFVYDGRAAACRVAVAARSAWRRGVVARPRSPQWWPGCARSGGKAGACASAGPWWRMSRAVTVGAGAVPVSVSGGPAPDRIGVACVYPIRQNLVATEQRLNGGVRYIIPGLVLPPQPAIGAGRVYRHSPPLTDLLRGYQASDFIH
jgi:hypothetical protein